MLMFALALAFAAGPTSQPPPVASTGGGPPPTPISPPPRAPILSGPQSVRVGQTVEISGSEAGDLCYKHGTSRIRCTKGGPSWNVKILPGLQQFFTLRVNGVVIGRLVYRDAGLQVVVPKTPAPPAPPEPPSSSGSTTGSSGPSP
jgi:hypothetical protein